MTILQNKSITPQKLDKTAILLIISSLYIIILYNNVKIGIESMLIPLGVIFLLPWNRTLPLYTALATSSLTTGSLIIPSIIGAPINNIMDYIVLMFIFSLFGIIISVNIWITEYRKISIVPLIISILILQAYTFINTPNMFLTNDVLIIGLVIATFMLALRPTFIISYYTIILISIISIKILYNFYNYVSPLILITPFIMASIIGFKWYSANRHRDSHKLDTIIIMAILTILLIYGIILTLWPNYIVIMPKWYIMVVVLVFSSLISLLVKMYGLPIGLGTLLLSISIIAIISKLKLINYEIFIIIYIPLMIYALLSKSRHIISTTFLLIIVSLVLINTVSTANANVYEVRKEFSISLPTSIEYNVLEQSKVRLDLSKPVVLGENIAYINISTNTKIYNWNNNCKLYIEFNKNNSCKIRIVKPEYIMFITIYPGNDLKENILAYTYLSTTNSIDNELNGTIITKFVIKEKWINITMIILLSLLGTILLLRKNIILSLLILFIMIPILFYSTAFASTDYLASESDALQADINYNLWSLEILVYDSKSYYARLWIDAKVFNDVVYDYAIYTRLVDEARVDVILHYNLSILDDNETMISGEMLLHDNSWLFLSSLAREYRLSNITISSLWMSVVVDGSRSIKVDLADLLENTGKLWFIPGYKQMYFDVEIDVVDAMWINIWFKDSRRNTIGVLKITSFGPFNNSQSIRFMLESFNRDFAEKTNVYIIVKDELGTTYRAHLIPGFELYIPQDVNVSEGSLDVNVSIVAPYINKTINLTQLLNASGGIHITEKKNIVKELKITNISIEALNSGWTRIRLAIDDADAGKVKARYYTLKGKEPLALIAAIVPETNRSQLDIYMALPGKSVGILELEYEASGIVKESWLEVTLNGSNINGVSQEITLIYNLARLKPDISLPDLPEIYSFMEQASWLFIASLNETLDPCSLLILDLSINVTKYNNLEPVFIWPVIKAVDEEWAYVSYKQEFLANGSGPLKIFYDDNNIKYRINIPGSYLLSAPPMECGKPRVLVTTIMLVISNVEKVDLLNASLFKVEYGYKEPIGSSTSIYNNFLYNKFSILILFIMIILVSVIVRYRWR